MKYRRRYKKDDPAQHADDWLMTYADLITLLLCFFAIFLSVSIPKKDIKDKQLVRPIEQAGKAPDIMEGNLPLHGTARAETPTVALTEELAEELSRTLNEASVAAPKVEQQGDRITTVEMSSAAFFDSGAAALSPEGAAILKDMAESFAQEKYHDYQITVEGHTDDNPIGTPQFPSNWELSTARAAAVVKFFIGEGISPQKLRAAGYADTFPKLPNRDIAGHSLPDNQAQNRRVVIKLEKIDKNQRI